MDKGIEQDCFQDQFLFTSLLKSLLSSKASSLESCFPLIHMFTVTLLDLQEVTKIVFPFAGVMLSISQRKVQLMYCIVLLFIIDSVILTVTEVRLTGL